MIKALFAIMLILVACQGQDEAAPLNVATDPSAPPLEFLQDGSTDPTGLDIDILAAVAAVGNFNYNIVQAAWTDLFAQVEANQVDFAISGITINDARRETYDFSVPYYLSTHKILAPEGTDITSAQDLANKVVAVRDGTTAATAVEGILGADNPNIQRYANQNEAIQAVVDGQADAWVDDNALVEYYANNNAGYVVIEDANAFEKEFYGLLFPKGSDLAGSINEAITTVLQNGEYTAIYNRWLGVDPDVDLLLAAGEESDPYDALEEGCNEEENGEGEDIWID